LNVSADTVVSWLIEAGGAGAGESQNAESEPGGNASDSGLVRSCVTWKDGLTHNWLRPWACPRRQSHLGWARRVCACAM